MILADRVGLCHAPFVAIDNQAGCLRMRANTSDDVEAVAKCVRCGDVLADDITQLCADLAYSKGAGTLACADLLRMPATQFWVEWCNAPWQRALQRYGFPLIEGSCQWVGRRGVLVNAALGGRTGMMKHFGAPATTGERRLPAASKASLT